jgi:maltose O-acetyltransferase
MPIIICYFGLCKSKIRDNVFIGPNCSFYTAGHPLDVQQRNEGLEYAHPITVGDNVWLGGNVVVLPEFLSEIIL